MLDKGPKALRQIKFNGNLDRHGDTTMFFITEEEKRTILDLSKGTVGILWIYLALI